MSGHQGGAGDSEDGGWQQQGPSRGRGRGGGRGGRGGGQYRGGGGGDSYQGGGRGAGQSQHYRGSGQPRPTQPHGGGGAGGSSYRGGGGGSGHKGPLYLRAHPIPLKNISFADENDKTIKHGWTQNVDENSYLPPVRLYREEAPSTSRRIKIETNHVETYIKFPERLYHYEINVKQGEKAPKKLDDTEKLGKGMCQLAVAAGPAGSPAKKPAKPPGGGPSGSRANNDGDIGRNLWRKIVIEAVKKIEARHEKLTKTPIKLACDFSRALYSTKLIAGTEECYVVQSAELPDDSFETNNKYIVTVNITKTEIDTAGLTKAINNAKGLKIDNRAEIEQIYNIVLKTMPMAHFIPVGRASFFGISDRSNSIGGGLECANGFSSIYTFGFKPFINIDTANTAFIIGKNVLELLYDLFAEESRVNRSLKYDDVHTWQSRHVAMANELLKTVVITYQRKNQTISKRVKDVLDQAPHEYEFAMKDSTQMNNVEQYVSKTLGARLVHKQAPCLVLGDGSAVLPAEMCKVKKGQSYTKKLADFQTANMIKYTANKPDVRKQRIVDSINKCTLQRDPVLREFGVEVPKLALCTFEVTPLSAPYICYGANGDQRIDAEGGVWNVWDHKFNFIEPMAVPVWNILLLRERKTPDKDSFESNLRAFLDQLRSMAEQCGMKLGERSFKQDNMIDIDIKVHEFEEKLKGTLTKYKEQNTNLVLVIIPKKGHQCYGTVKRIAELDEHKIGVLTQCIAYPNVAKKQRATIGNLLFKMNAKLGGINHIVQIPRDVPTTAAINKYRRLDFFYCPTLIIGADVTHPSGVGSTAPSVAAVAGCHDFKWQKFSMLPKVQARPDKGAAEVIEDFGQMVKELLFDYKHKNNGIDARRIIIFRDGVGDGQYAEVLIKELQSLRNACHEIGKDYEPKITFLTVQKRHKTRVFPGPGCSEQDIGRNDKNLKPGVIVDKEIVHPHEMDFYMLSHQGIQGTSRPTRYHLLWDDSDLNAFEIHNLTYFLCYGYSRCTRSVSIPAPTYYAHLAAYRVRNIMESMTGIQPPSKDDADFVNEYKAYLTLMNEKIRRHPDIKKNAPMHFV